MVKKKKEVPLCYDYSSLSILYSYRIVIVIEIVSKFIGYEVLQSVAFLHINKQKKGDLKITVRL